MGMCTCLCVMPIEGQHLSRDSVLLIHLAVPDHLKDIILMMLKVILKIHLEVNSVRSKYTTFG